MRAMICLCFLFVAAPGVSDEANKHPQRISDDEVIPAVCGVLVLPDTPGPHPSVILLPGSSGWRPEYARIAENFADSGFIVLAIDYYAATGLDTSREDKARKLPVWQATIRNAVTYLKEKTYTSGIGLVGYSRGAFLAVSVASSLPEPSAVVDV